MKMIKKTKYALMATGLAFGLAAFAEPLGGAGIGSGLFDGSPEVAPGDAIIAYGETAEEAM